MGGWFTLLLYCDYCAIARYTLSSGMGLKTAGLLGLLCASGAGLNTCVSDSFILAWEFTLHTPVDASNKRRRNSSTSFSDRRSVQAAPISIDTVSCVSNLTVISHGRFILSAASSFPTSLSKNFILLPLVGVLLYYTMN